MRNILKKCIAALLCVCAIPFTFGGCKETENSGDSGIQSIQYNFDKSGFYGLCEVFGDMGGGVDPAITNDWISDMAGALGVSSYRMWISYGDIYQADENDDLTPNQSKISILHDAIDKLKAAGVKNFLALCTSFVYPADYPTTTGYVVPDPYEEYDMYVRFMRLQQKAYTLFAEEFPEVCYYEPANEPEFGSCIHKNGYTHGGSEAVNSNYMYTQYEQTRIVADLCWYTTNGVQSANPYAKVTNPSLVGYATSYSYLDDLYKAIESSALPVGQEKSDVDPDNYFQILNWHPYTFSADRVSDDWVELQNGMYEVAIKHGDGGKPVWFSEFGWTDYGQEYKQQTIADAFVEFFDTVKAKMPYVQTVMIFRLTNLYTQNVSEGENNFGIMYNKDDPLHGGAPKPVAVALAKYIRGEAADLTNLYKYAKK